VSDGAEIGGLRGPGQVATTGAELFVRHARKDGRSVAIIRAVDHGTSCIVEAEVFPAGAGGAGADLTRPGPYTFANAHEATAFVTEAVQALMYLGCDIAAE
jgi:predicted nucleotidyltransferase